MKVKALARLSTAKGWKTPGDLFEVPAAEVDALVQRGVVERVDAEPTVKAPKAPKAKT